MLTVEVNPEGFGPEYLRCLNTCFPHWGGDDVYQWCFERPMAGRKADQMVVRLDGEVVAGSAVSYRTVGFPGGRTALAGIMTGSWTLPAARGQGCFSRVIAESVSLATHRGCAALLAFVTEDNPSCRQLQKAGSILVPTFYLFSDADTKLPEGAESIEPQAPDPQRIEAVAQSLHAGRAGQVRFVYSSPQEFASQFLDRPTQTEICQTADGALGVLERAADTDRLQLLLSSCIPANNREDRSRTRTAPMSALVSATTWGAATVRERSAADLSHELAADTRLQTVLSGFLHHSLSRHRKLFLFSTLDKVRDACLSLGMRVKNGYLTILPAGTRAWEETFAAPADQGVPSWNLESGDRI